MFSDHLCQISWRAKPRSFVSLMTLYESNFIRLGWLVRDLPRLDGRRTSTVANDPTLELEVLQRSRYTTTLGLSYLLDGETIEAPRTPGLSVRVYHDARLAEACLAGAVAPRLPQRLVRSFGAGGDDRWNWNMMLNKWLEYCAGCGHHFPPLTS